MLPRMVANPEATREGCRGAGAIPHGWWGIASGEVAVELLVLGDYPVRRFQEGLVFGEDGLLDAEAGEVLNGDVQGAPTSSCSLVS